MSIYLLKDYNLPHLPNPQIGTVQKGYFIRGCSTCAGAALVISVSVATVTRRGEPNNV